MLVWIGDALCSVDEPLAIPSLPLFIGSDSVIRGEYPEGPLPVAGEPPTGEG